MASARRMLQGAQNGAITAWRYKEGFFQGKLGDGRRSELDKYLEKLGTDGWKLTTTGFFDGKGYQFGRYRFRRAIEEPKSSEATLHCKTVSSGM